MFEKLFAKNMKGGFVKSEILCVGRLAQVPRKKWNIAFLAALAALYLTLVSGWVSECHFRILTQRVTFETSDPSDI